jgi:hypothetical protein
MTRFTKLAAVAAFALPFIGHAADFDYSFVQLDYRELNVDRRPDADGLALRGSLEVAPHVFVMAEYGGYEFDRGLDWDSWRIGGGGHWPINNAWDLVGKIGYAKEDIENFEDKSGLFVYGGVRGALAPKFELDAGLEYADLEEPFDEITLLGELRYNFTPAIAAGVLVRVGDDVSALGLSGRFSF